MVLVDPAVTALKVDREIEQWNENAVVYRKRGWILLSRRDNELEVGFLAQLPLGQISVPVMAACVHLSYENYDLWPPSLEFIDPVTGDYVVPTVPAVISTPEGPRNLLVGQHPETRRPFLCVPGIRQYHDHPQHSGDPWLLHRASGEGSLVTVCERVWRSMARSLVGLQLVLTTFPEGSPQSIQLQLALVTGDIDAIRAQTETQVGDPAA